MKDECLICGAPLNYLKADRPMICAVCHKTERSKTVCENGHYVCGECHTQGMDSIIGVCLAIVKAVEFTKDSLGAEMELHAFKCTHSAQNNQCIGLRCPFF